MSTHPGDRSRRAAPVGRHPKPSRARVPSWRPSWRQPGGHDRPRCLCLPRPESDAKTPRPRLGHATRCEQMRNVLQRWSCPPQRPPRWPPRRRSMPGSASPPSVTVACRGESTKLRAPPLRSQRRERLRQSRRDSLRASSEALGMQLANVFPHKIWVRSSSLPPRFSAVREHDPNPPPDRLYTGQTPGRGGRVAEGTRLLSEYGDQTPSRVRIPPSP